MLLHTTAFWWKFLFLLDDINSCKNRAFHLVYFVQAGDERENENSSTSRRQRRPNFFFYKKGPRSGARTTSRTRTSSSTIDFQEQDDNINEKSQYSAAAAAPFYGPPTSSTSSSLLVFNSESEGENVLRDALGDVETVQRPSFIEINKKLEYTDKMKIDEREMIWKEKTSTGTARTGEQQREREEVMDKNRLVEGVEDREKEQFQFLENEQIEEQRAKKISSKQEQNQNEKIEEKFERHKEEINEKDDKKKKGKPKGKAKAGAKGGGGGGGGGDKKKCGGILAKFEGMDKKKKMMVGGGAVVSFVLFCFCFCMCCRSCRKHHHDDHTNRVKFVEKKHSPGGGGSWGGSGAWNNSSAWGGGGGWDNSWDQPAYSPPPPAPAIPALNLQYTAY